MNAHAGCDQPPLVLIPADAEGRESEVNADLEAYRQGMEEYVSCIRTELEAAGDGASELYKRVLVARNNLAVAEAENVYRWYTSVIGPAPTTGPPSPGPDRE